MRVLVLGCGLQGRAVLHDLDACPGVAHMTCADAVVLRVHAEVAKLSGKKTAVTALEAREPGALGALIRGGFDVVIDMLPRQFVRSVGEAAIASRGHLVNTFYGTALADLDSALRQAGIAILPEMGLDPGIDLVMAAELDMGRCAGRVCATVTAHPGRPCCRRARRRALRRGDDAPARSRTVRRTRGVSKRRCRSLCRTSPYHRMRETGRALCVALARALCILARQLVRFLEPPLQYGPPQRDLVVRRVEASGHGGPDRSLTLGLADYRDKESSLLAMNRTVGFAASIAAQMLANGVIEGRGVLSPIRDVPWQPFVHALATRGIEIVEAAT